MGESRVFRVALTLAVGSVGALFFQVLGLPLILALSPGGFAEMTLAALSMNIDPAFVTTHHGLRLLVIVFILPIVLSFWFKRTKGN